MTEGISSAPDPLQRLCENAAYLCTSTWLIRSWAEHSHLIEPDLALGISLFTSRLRAVCTHAGPEWGMLRAANPYPVADGEKVAQSHVELSAFLAQRTYSVLLEADSGKVAARRWEMQQSEYRELSVASIRKQWDSACRELLHLPRFDHRLLDAQISKEFQRAKAANATDGDLLASTDPLTDSERDVLTYISEHGPVAGKEICTALQLEQSALTGRIIPRLRQHGVKNRRGAGYYIDRPRSIGAAMT